MMETFDTELLDHENIFLPRIWVQLQDVMLTKNGLLVLSYSELILILEFVCTTVSPTPPNQCYPQLLQHPHGSRTNQVLCKPLEPASGSAPSFAFLGTSTSSRATEAVFDWLPQFCCFLVEIWVY